MTEMRGVSRAFKRAGVPGKVAIAAALLALAACNPLMKMAHGAVDRPAATEFGMGPRSSAGGTYVATLQSSQPLKLRRMQTVKLVVRNAHEDPVEDATILVDGGMPEHGHGLPTAPRVTKQLGEGVYQVEGLKFNMGGWWELKFRIASAAGTDSVTFNLDL